MKGKVLISLALCSVMLSGCDFFRGLVGRPLSSEIEAKREKIELALREKEQRRLDSLARISKIEADSLAAVSRLGELSAVILEARSLGGLVDETQPGYCIVVGSFKNSSNAEKLAEKLGVDSHYISDIECGTRNITFKTLYKIMTAIEVEPNKLFTFD